MYTNIPQKFISSINVAYAASWAKQLKGNVSDNTDPLCCACRPGPKIVKTYECKIIVQYVAEQKAECSTGELVMETLDCFMVLVVRGMKQHWKNIFYKLSENLL